MCRKRYQSRKLLTPWVPGDSLITSFMVAYTDHLKKGITGETAIRESLAAAAEFASKVCGMNGAFGYRQKI